MSEENRRNDGKAWRRLFVALTLLVLAILIYLMYRNVGVPGIVLPVEAKVEAPVEAPAEVHEQIPRIVEEPNITTASSAPTAAIKTESVVETEKPREISPPIKYTKLQEPCSGEAANAVDLFIGIYTECPDQIYGYSIDAN